MTHKSTQPKGPITPVTNDTLPLHSHCTYYSGFIFPIY